VIAPDRRGHGRSDAAPRGYDFDTLADDLALVLDRMHVRDAVIVGHSMGAAEVVRYLTRHGAQHAVRAVLIAPTTPFLLRTADNPDGAPRDALARGRDMLRLDFHRRIAAAAPEFFGAPAIDVPAAAIDWWVRTIVDECSLAVMLALHRAMTETDFRPELKSLAIPTLILHGDADTSARLDLTGRRTHELIRGSELKIYPGAAHGIAYTHAERVLSDILAFAG
jgi:pimeloyl-ACP methyl ester carboxylesterase